MISKHNDIAIALAGLAKDSFECIQSRAFKRINIANIQITMIC